MLLGFLFRIVFRLFFYDICIERTCFRPKVHLFKEVGYGVVEGGGLKFCVLSEVWNESRPATPDKNPHCVTKFPFSLHAIVAVSPGCWESAP